MSKNVSSIKEITIRMYSMLEKWGTIHVNGIPHYFLNFHNQKQDDWGGFSLYYKLSPHIGIKLYRMKYRRLGNLARSRTFNEAKEEVAMLNLASTSGFTPRIAHEVIIKRRGYYLVGIVMEHIKGDPLCNLLDGALDCDKFSASKKGLLLKNTSGYEIKSYLYEKLKDKTRVKHQDLHTGNIIVGPDKKLYVIDFSPDYCRLARKK